MTAAHKLETLVFCTKLSIEWQLRAPCRQAALRLPSITSENPTSPLPIPCVPNSRTAITRKLPSLHTGRTACSHQLIPLCREPDTSTGRQCGKHIGHIHTPLGYTVLLHSLNSLTSKLHLSTYSKTRKNCKILVQNGGWLGESAL